MKTEDGQQVVLIDPKGNITKSPDYVEGASDQNPVWSPDGQRVYFNSDRVDLESHMFRWNPARNLVERRTIDKRTKTEITFDQAADAAGEFTALLVSGGTVLIVAPQTLRYLQIMPPGGTDKGGEGNGESSLFQQVYDSLGYKSVKYARWSKDREYLMIVIKRDDGSEVLVAQKTEPVAGSELPGARKISLTPETAPLPIVVGDRIEFDVSPVSGDVVYAVLGFQLPSMDNVPPQFKDHGVVKLPFRHIVGIYHPGDPGIFSDSETARAFIVLSDKDEFSFSQPKVSPDGTKVACQVGPYEGAGIMQPHNIVLLEAKPKGSQETLVNSKSLDISWHPNSKSLLFTAEAEGYRSIFSVDIATKKVDKITGPNQSFSGPIWSPSTK